MIGSNILNIALQNIPNQTLEHKPFIELEIDKTGKRVPKFGDSIDADGSFQAIPRRLYAVQGLDMEKNYANFFSSAEIGVIDRDKSGDLLIFENKTYNALSSTPWNSVDGWNEYLLVEIKGQ